MKARSTLALLLACHCVNPRMVQTALDETEATMARAEQVHARRCAPEPTASAASNLEFARLEFRQGDVRRAQEHLNVARTSAVLALEAATPCGTADRDGDKVADIIDRCPDEKEDLDGENDQDGCRDLDPEGDVDLDGIKNIDDGCVDVREDMDGDADDDGCPETSADSDGDTVIDVTDKCPSEAEDNDGWESEDGCPDPDNDGDGVPDLLDACSGVKEDVDGFRDEDGCPDPDNDGDGMPDVTDICPLEPGSRDRAGCPLLDADGDGIADANDRCPAASEVLNAYLDGDGCPDNPPTRVRVTSARIEALEPIVFASGTADITGGSGALSDVAKVLADAPTLKLRIEGHTDNEGEESANVVLSERRAQAIRLALVRLGVDPGRLEAVGFGASRPIDTNRTPAGRARNRRVDLLIANP
jgi:outer membrane protein OmpA-like peptidoglycan-associated protein